MYEIGDFAMLASAIFAGIGLYMAHTLYKSPRKRWQCVAAWSGIILLCTAVGEVLNVLLPQYTEQRLAIFTGCAFVFAYLYVFSNIPLPQRIFTYFLVDNSMYLLVLLCRTLTMLLVYYLGVDAQSTFAVCYLLTAAAFCCFYIKVLRAVILRGLAAFQRHLVSLTVFAVVSYISLLFIVDVWAPWPPLSVAGALPCFGILAINLGGYLLAFRTLGVMSERMSAEQDAKLAGLQLTLAEKEYHAAVQGFNQLRQLRHDMNHHFDAIAALAREGDTQGVLAYLHELTGLAPARERELSPGNFITNSFLGHYKELCGEKGIDFRCQTAFDEGQLANKAHLGIVLGNTLQNAYEAACKHVTPDSFIEVVIRRINSNLVFAVKNSYGGTLQSGLPSTKTGEGHGVGLASVKSIVGLYDGYLELSFGDGIFAVNLVLGIKAAGEGTCPLRQEEEAGVC